MAGGDEIDDGELVGDREHFLDSRQTEASRVASCGEDVDDEEAKRLVAAIHPRRADSTGIDDGRRARVRCLARKRKMRERKRPRGRGDAGESERSVGARETLPTGAASGSEGRRQRGGERPRDLGRYRRRRVRRPEPLAQSPLDILFSFCSGPFHLLFSDF